MAVNSTYVEKRVTKVKLIEPFPGFHPRDLSSLSIDDLYIKLKHGDDLKPTYNVKVDASFEAYSRYSDAYQSWEKSITNVMLFISRINLKRAQETIAAAEKRRKNGTDGTEEVDPFFEDLSRPVLKSPKSMLSLRKPIAPKVEPVTSTPIHMNEGLIPNGTRISWSSQASGISKEKTGIVLKYIAAGSPSRQFIPLGVASRRINGIDVSTVDRYLVEVEGKSGSEYNTPLAVILDMTFKTQKYKK